MRNTEEDILIIGNSRRDSLAKSDAPLQGEENIGTIFETDGGVGRNVAENLARLNDSVTFITPLGDDENGRLLRKNLEAVNVKVLSPKSKLPTSVYTSISDDKGNRKLAIVDNRIIDNMKPADLKPFESVIASHQHIVIEATLNEKVIDYLFKKFAGHSFYCEGVSSAYVGRLKKHLPDIYLFKSNFNEAVTMMGTEAEPEETVQDILKEGCPNVVLSHTKLPIVYGTKGEVYHEPIVVRQNIIRSNGVGDSLFAGIVHCLASNVSLPKAVKFGLNMSYCTLGVDTAVDPDVDRVLNQ
ncbi:MAG: PfkB family carbohydrate kinase [Bacilli bacterium]|jgi:pseudouridine kinase|nr:PfkB family carbohydrate kinase [Bacilli bacterium]